MSQLALPIFNTLPFNLVPSPSVIQAPGGTLYLRCAVCQVRLGELYLDDGRVAICLSCPVPSAKDAR